MRGNVQLALRRLARPQQRQHLSGDNDSRADTSSGDESNVHIRALDASHSDDTIMPSAELRNHFPAAPSFVVAVMLLLSIAVALFAIALHRVGVSLQSL